ncbi:hypothetical protein BpHYR1_041528 [Brachionus plicatilis]|uniref:Uncharacterized protein n=1 Tax=Brachionus plicatilis TaxID=10195 RepID=A0A3M7S438_BRAPC|nr:hypothetical protein BpHYR1_041528 [Brachionus plicatilis]
MKTEFYYLDFLNRSSFEMYVYVFASKSLMIIVDYNSVDFLVETPFLSQISVALPKQRLQKLE